MLGRILSRLYLKYLLQEAAVSTMLRLGAAVLAMLAGSYVVVGRLLSGQGMDEGAFYLTLVVVLAMLSGILRSLRSLRESIWPLLGPLPLNRYLWVLLDTSLLAAAWIAILCPLVLYLYFNYHVMYLVRLPLLASLPVVLVAFYWIVAKTNAQSVFFSVLLSILWFTLLLSTI